MVGFDLTTVVVSFQILTMESKEIEKLLKFRDYFRKCIYLGAEFLKLLELGLSHAAQQSATRAQLQDEPSPSSTSPDPSSYIIRFDPHREQ